MNLQYEEKDGLRYPILNMGMDGIHNLGKFGKARLTYMHANKNELYQYLFISGTLLNYLEKIDTTCYEQSEVLHQEYLSKYNLSQLDFMEMVQLRTQVRNMADEVVLNHILE